MAGIPVLAGINQTGLALFGGRDLIAIFRGPEKRPRQHRAEREADQEPPADDVEG